MSGVIGVKYWVLGEAALQNNDKYQAGGLLSGQRICANSSPAASVSEKKQDSSAFLKCAEAREKLTFLMKCKRVNILLPSNRRKHVHFDLLIEQQNRNLREVLLKLKEIAKVDREAWKLVNHDERRAVYRERDKTKLRFKKKVQLDAQ